MRIVFETNHLSSIGGGELYLMQFCKLFDRLFDFYVVQNFHPQFELFNGFGEKFKIYDGSFQPDLYISCSYNSLFRPIGKKNWVIVFFPNKNNPPIGYDGIVSICPYTSKWIEEYWNRNSIIIQPTIDTGLYKQILPKKKQIISIGHFFEEEDGHSKNQHILIDAFKDLPDYELLLVGNVYNDDMHYIHKVVDKIKDKNIKVAFNVTHEELINELAVSSHLWHANGFKRTNPAQVEHFGIIVLEAWVSGAIPIVHNSGGAKDIYGLTWDTPDELSDITLKNQVIKPFDNQYMLDYSEKLIIEWLYHL